MIAISRSLARQLRAVLRRCAGRNAGTFKRWLVFQTDSTGLRVQLADTEVSAEFRQAGSYAAETVTLPLDALASFEGRGQDLVQLDADERGQPRARWDEGGVPQIKVYEPPDRNPPLAFPERPTTWTAQPADLWSALAEAAETASDDSVRFALTHLLLRGRTGQIVATDARQLLIQGGFTFPWQEDLLIPASKLFGQRSLVSEGPIDMGHSATHVSLCTGAWTFHFTIDKVGRYPQFEQIVPAAASLRSHARLDADDAAFLRKTLPHLPGDEAWEGVTVDLNGKVCIRARNSAQPRVTEVALVRSTADGEPLRFCVHRKFLARALELGFTQIDANKADAPFVCADERKTFIVMPFDAHAVLPPSDDVFRIESATPATPSASPSTAPLAPPPNGEKAAIGAPQSEPTPTPTANGSANGHRVVNRLRNSTAAKKNGTHAEALIDEVNALKGVLRDAFGRANQILATIRRQKKESRLLKSTLQSLRQLQKIGE